MITPNLYPFYTLLWAYDIWFTQTGALNRPGNCNMQHWNLIVILYVCFLKSVFQCDLWPPPSEFVFHACKCLMFLSALGNIRHLHEWGTNSEGGGAKIWHVECITMSFLAFFQFGENTQWIMDGFAVGRMCARCVDIDHLCTKAPWV